MNIFPQLAKYGFTSKKQEAPALRQEPGGKRVEAEALKFKG